MPETFLSIIIGLVAGGIGGIVGGTIDRNYSLGTLGNAVVGVIAGGLSVPALAVLAVTVATADGSLVVDDSPVFGLASRALLGAVAGAIVALVAGAVKNMIAEHKSNTR